MGYSVCAARTSAAGEQLLLILLRVYPFNHHAQTSLDSKLKGTHRLSFSAFGRLEPTGIFFVVNYCERFHLGFILKFLLEKKPAARAWLCKSYVNLRTEPPLAKRASKNPFFGINI